MEKTEKLREARNILLKLHKTLVDQERSSIEGVSGTISSTDFLNMLLNNKDLEWLRRFSTLIVDIDEMFAQKDAIGVEAIDAHLARMSEIAGMEDGDADFKAKYASALAKDRDAAALHDQLKRTLE